MSTTRKQSAVLTGMQLPDVDSFEPVQPVKFEELPVGRVEGLDYSKWATAIIDLTSSPQRVQSDRLRIANKGFKKVEGEVLVHGFESAEVWVIPRPMYEQLRNQRAKRIEAMVRDGRMMEFANRQGEVTRGRG